MSYCLKYVVRVKKTLVVAPLVCAIYIVLGLQNPAWPQTIKREYKSDPAGISAVIDSSLEDKWIPINSTLEISVMAGDMDSVRSCLSETGYTPWWQYHDDVTSGNTEEYHHIEWTVTAGGGAPTGSFPAGRWGQSVTYQAPDYGGIGAKTITCKVDDNDLTDPENEDSEDTNGSTENSPNSNANDDPAVTDSITINIWQVTVSIQQSGTESVECNGFRVPYERGGVTLGETDYGKSVKYENTTLDGTPWLNRTAENFCTNTQLKGVRSVTNPQVPTDFAWYQKMSGKNYKWLDGDTAWSQDGPTKTDVDDGPQPRTPQTGADSSTINTQHALPYPDVNKTFLRDAPGFGAWTALNGNTGDTARFLYPELKMNRNYTYKTWVQNVAGPGGTSVRISNLKEWSLQMEIQRANPSSTWSRVTWQDRS